MGIYRFQSNQIENFCSLYDKTPKSDKNFEEGHHAVLLTVHASDFKYYLKK